MDLRLPQQMKHINLLYTEIDTAYHEAALRMGLSDSAMLILYTAVYNGGQCLLSDITCILSKQTINSALRKLEGEGILVLEAADGKKKKVCLTDYGRRYAEKTVYPLIEIEDEIFSGWSEEDAALYVSLTQRFLADFKEKSRTL